MRTAALIIFLLLASFFLAPHVIEFIGRRQVQPMTPEKAQALLARAGGIDELSHETKLLLEHRGTNDFPFFFPEQLTNAPAILSLYNDVKNYSGRDWGGTTVAIWPENDRCLEIRFGNHWVFKYIFIYDPDDTNALHENPAWLTTPRFAVSSNIFVSK